MGRRVPDDISVLGFDNTRTSQHVFPALSTIAQPLERMGELAVERLLATEDSVGPVPRILPHRLIERGSTTSLTSESNNPTKKEKS
jgi:LacI family transcriptional regulator